MPSNGLLPHHIRPPADSLSTRWTNCRHGRLLCRGAPLSFLDGEWVRQDSDVKSSPRFAHSDDPKLHLTSDGAAWRVTRGAGSGEVIAEAASTALHPGTVEVGSWKVFDRGKELPKSAELEMLCDGPNTEEQPFLMEELGRDFFLRVHLTRKVVWFVCPATGDIYHSAAKPGGEGGRSKPGKRYCHLSNKAAPPLRSPPAAPLSRSPTGRPCLARRSASLPTTSSRSTSSTSTPSWSPRSRQRRRRRRSSPGSRRTCPRPPTQRESRR